MRIWPAIDIRDGNCVRRKQGDAQRETVYGSSPADMALRWVSDGADGIRVVDLDGASQGTPVNFDAIAELAREVDVPVLAGGGIRDTETIVRFLDAGVDKIAVATRALNDPVWAAEITQRYPGKIYVAIDCRDGFAASDGWQNTTDVSAFELASEISRLPLAGIIYTDISKDGMLSGPNFEAIGRVNETVNVPVIASGGVATLEDVSRLATLGLAGCVVGRSLYDGHLTLAQVINAADAGVSTS